MRFLTFIIFFSLSLFGNIKVSNYETKFNNAFLMGKSELKKRFEVTLFNNTKLFKNNGALVGLLKKDVDLVVVENSFIDSILDNKSLKEIGFARVYQGEFYSLLSREADSSSKEIEQFLAIIKNHLKGF